MFNCDVSTLSAINSAADSIKGDSTNLWVFLNTSFFSLNFFTSKQISYVIVMQMNKEHYKREIPYVLGEAKTRGHKYI
jgi:hypothetical protein